MTDYNLPKAMSLLKQALAGFALFFALVASGHAAARWDSPVTELARKIAAASGPGTTTLEVRNVSSISPEQVPVIRRSLEQQLRSEGILIRPEHEASVGIRLTLSQNRRGWLWIAEVQQGTEARVVMLELPEERAAGAKAAAHLISLHGSLLLSATEVLLDVQPLAAPQGLLAALTTRSVLLYQQQGGHWQLAREIAIPLKGTLPRDPRGRIVPGSDHLFDLYLPGGTCATTGDNLAAVTLNCLASDDPWPLGGQGAFFNSARNYFTGVLVPGLGRAMQPFYSAAMIPHAKYALWIFASADGRVTSFDGTNERHLGGAARNWGSDIVAMNTACGSGTQLLATESVAGAGTDSLQAFEIADREPMAASAPLKLDGSIVALWTTSAANSATAIVRTTQGGYDAYSISLACNQ